MRKNIRIAVVMLLVLALATAGVSFAWFMENMEIKVSSGDNMNISVGGDLQVKWHDDITWGSALKGDVNNITMLDCSGNGEDFFTGNVDDNGDITPGTMIQLKDEELKSAVLEVAVDLRASQKMDVYLGSVSAVDPIIRGYVEDPNEKNNNSITGGKFSADWIAAAVRVAFIEVITNENGETTEKLKFIWVPNADAKLNADNTFDESGADIPLKYEYCKGIDDNSNPIVDTDTYDKGKLDNNFVLAQGDQLCNADNKEVKEKAANLSPKIVSFTEEGKMQEKHLIIRIWFEGYDNECTKAMLGGKVKYTFSFAGMVARKDADVTNFNATSISATGNAENGYTLTIPESLKGKIIYSTNGFDYSDYTEGTPITGATEVYLRIKETKSTYASNILKIDLAQQGGGQ